jgi:uncharacterized membrane protein YphA (DoxX/SURF4 family)
VLVLGVLSRPLWWLAALICLPFAVSALSKAFDPPAALDEMAVGGFPRSPLLLLVIIFYQLGSVTLILSTLAPTLGVLLLAGFLLAATFTYHQFWRERGAVRIAKINHFAENLGLIGALGLIALAG